MYINRYTTPLHLWEYLRFSASRLSRAFQPISRPVDLMFVFCDHFEGRSLSLTETELERWVECYPKMALPHRDSDGYPPRHTWFYLYSDEADNVALLRHLSKLCLLGCGEIEFHLHHGRGYFEGRPAHNVFPNVETPGDLNKLILRALGDFNQAGALITDENPGRVQYGIIHGAWALDNSRWMRGYHGWCGVNNELEILKDTGCYADFTFPAWGTMQPAKINCIYYAKDDPARPKSYNTGIDLCVGGPSRDDVVIFEGPAFGGTDISHAHPPSPARCRAWVRSGVHVKGRPNWIFVKVHTHGCQDPDTLDLLLGQRLDEFFSFLEETYGNGESYRLHYVTAREAYNIAKAAEAGMDGDAGQFRNFVIPPYRNSRVVGGDPVHALEHGRR